MRKKGGFHLQPIISLFLALSFFVFPTNESLSERATSYASVSDVTINHKIKGKDVYIECIIPNFSFHNDNQNVNVRRGNVHVFLNDKKYKEVNQAAFILKNLPTGNHKITLKFMDENGTYRYSKSFYVDIK